MPASNSSASGWPWSRPRGAPGSRYSAATRRTRTTSGRCWPGACSTATSRPGCACAPPSRGLDRARRGVRERRWFGAFLAARTGRAAAAVRGQALAAGAYHAVSGGDRNWPSAGRPRAWPCAGRPGTCASCRPRSTCWPGPTWPAAARWTGCSTRTRPWWPPASAPTGAPRATRWAASRPRRPRWASSSRPGRPPRRPWPSCSRSITSGARPAPPSAWPSSVPVPR